jgi:hypothetical protein
LLLVHEVRLDDVGVVSRVEGIERVIEQLPREDFEKLSIWLAQHCAERGNRGRQAPIAFRDHGAFLNSYTPEDEGLYDDAPGR